MNESFHIRRAIAELEVAAVSEGLNGVTDPRVMDAIRNLKEREIETIRATGYEGNYWSESDAAKLRCDAKRAARRAAREQSEKR